MKDLRQRLRSEHQQQIKQLCEEFRLGLINLWGMVNAADAVFKYDSLVRDQSLTL